jgi:hypothetical protein
MRQKNSVTCLEKCVTCFFLMNNTFRVLRNTLYIGISERVTSLLLFKRRMLRRCGIWECYGQRTEEAPSALPGLREGNGRQSLLAALRQVRGQDAALRSCSHEGAALRVVPGWAGTAGGGEGMSDDIVLSSSSLRTLVEDDALCARCSHTALWHSNVGQGECQVPSGCDCFEFKRITWAQSAALLSPVEGRQPPLCVDAKDALD